MNDSFEIIFKKLNKVIENSSSKYYHYPVAAILECTDGTLYSGVNIETSSPGAGICAERCAVFYAMANGFRKEHFKRIYLFNKTENIITPCYVCRQALNDYCNPDLEIVSFNIVGESKMYRLGDLLIESFEEGSLK